MKTTKVGFGVTKNLGNYENFRIYIEADLEPGEDCTLALDFLRTRVAAEAGFPQEYLDLRSKVFDAKCELSVLVRKLEEVKLDLEVATSKWSNLVNYFSSSDDGDDGDDGDCFESDSFEG
ncbi:MAG: hypothetical protein EAZ83_06885 [Oscillatoriales cyanobacterium]|nr:MAG: hypothetical protein EAZ83_06885 [Oscillatoriales cyanobacterium]